ncbi:winged helix-turn-helix domain-containing protein [Colwellia sp. RSH04]|uniref:winged helix-turn-helix domain-containing protein n=1 Tax=Colwellia sp. RSH04 TaxID=2305464 RepID=UPI000E5844EE|nr:winged helix-turn-helix domain-containing protein [Colwellia sp. RSH04]RHW75683.1 winged helix-turn-helix domain-containing protein [Colwellia sp. RSH04]
MEKGLTGLDNKPISDRLANLTLNQQLELKVFAIKRAQSNDGGRLIAADIQAYISNNFNVNYQIGNVYRLLHNLNLSRITTRSKHPKQSGEAQEVFKKF